MYTLIELRIMALAYITQLGYSNDVNGLRPLYWLDAKYKKFNG